MNNNIEYQYLRLLKDILKNGVEKEDRTCTGTISVFGRQIRHDMKLGFPLLTTKKMYFKGIVTELLWFLRGDTNIKYLVDNNCHIWDGDAYKSYVSSKAHPLDGKYGDTSVRKLNHMFPYEPILSKEEFINKIKTDDEFAKEYGDLGPIYGAQWRGWITSGFNEQAILNKESGYFEIDQIANSINLLKTDPDSRRNRVNAWNVGELDQMTLPPCHTDFQFFTRELSMDERQRLYFETCNRLKTPSIKGSTNKEKMESYFQEYNIPTRAISLMWNQRSVDTPLGLPFNIASYALLLEIIGKIVNMIPDELIGNLGDTHIYKNQIDGIKEQLNREPYPLPTLKIETEVKWVEGDCLPTYSVNDFTIENYQSHPTIKMPLSN